MSNYYGSSDDEESTRTLQVACDLGVTLFDTADYYGLGHNEQLVGRALAPHRGNVIIATKFGYLEGLRILGTPEYVREACEASLRRLGTDVIDVYYQHRVDPHVPIEDTVGAMSELVAAGKVRHLGLCEVSAQTLRRASAVHPIAALQSEWSLWTRDLEPEVLGVARELGVGIVPYSPLGRGYFAGSVLPDTSFDEGDFRARLPRFSGENLLANGGIVAGLRSLAGQWGCTAGQLALAWVLARGSDVVPIPGTKRAGYLRENVAAADVVLTPDQLASLESLVSEHGVHGARYATASGYGETPPAGGSSR